MRNKIGTLPVLAATVLLAICGVSRAQPIPASAELHVLPVQGNVYMLVGAGGNITIQVGNEGVVLVDTGLAPLAQRALAEIRKLSAKKIFWMVNTDLHPDHTGGNETLVKLAGSAEPGNSVRVIAHENVLNRMTARTAGSQPVPEAALPNDEYFAPHKDFLFNGEGVVVYHEPAAHTDGDSIVFFRRSDVISTGDIFVPGRYPVIDLQNGGTVQGLINALNHILDLAVAGKYQEGGTYVIPGHGRLCDEADVVEYRDMVTIVRDRVQDLIKKGMTLEQVKAARPTRDYDTEYDADAANTFVEAVYKSLTQKK